VVLFQASLMIRLSILDVHDVDWTSLVHYSLSTLPEVALLLLEAVFGGYEWTSGLATPLTTNIQTRPTGLMIYAFVFFCRVCMCNLVVSTFTDSYLRVAREDDHDAHVEELMENTSDKVYAALEDIDSAGNGRISWVELWFRLQKGPALLKLLGSTREDAHHFFRLLDPDDTGEVPVESFIFGLLRRNGCMKTLDSFVSEYNVKAVQALAKEPLTGTSRVVNRLRNVNHVLQTRCELVTEVLAKIRGDNDLELRLRALEARMAEVDRILHVCHMAAHDVAKDRHAALATVAGAGQDTGQQGGHGDISGPSPNLVEIASLSNEEVAGAAGVAGLHLRAELAALRKAVDRWAAAGERLRAERAEVG